MTTTITIEEFRATADECVRRVGTSRTPLTITDRGDPVAVLTSPESNIPIGRKRVLLPEYVRLVMNKPVEAGFIQESLDEIRGDR